MQKRSVACVATCVFGLVWVFLGTLILFPDVQHKHRYSILPTPRWFGTDKYIRLLHGHALSSTAQAYNTSCASLETSAFEPIMDLPLFMRYLFERFKYSSFLQLGCRNNRLFQLMKVQAAVSVCVDPLTESTHAMEVDDFFIRNSLQYDIILISWGPADKVTLEALHRHVTYALNALTDSGVLLLWNTHSSCIVGDKSADQRLFTEALWKVILALRQHLELDTATANFDGGVSCVKKRANTDPLVLSTANGDISTFPASLFEDGRVGFLNLKRFEEIHTWLKTLAEAGGVSVGVVNQWGGSEQLQSVVERTEARSACASIAVDTRSYVRARQCFQALLDHDATDRRARIAVMLLSLVEGDIRAAIEHAEEVSVPSPLLGQWAWEDVALSVLKA